jgi:pyruvate-ferredoxin/flavodoxin oxidoreductase
VVGEKLAASILNADQTDESDIFDHPDRIQQSETPLQLNSRSPKILIEQSMDLENRFKMLTKSEPAVAKRLLTEAQHAAEDRWHLYQYLAARPMEAQ